MALEQTPQPGPPGASPAELLAFERLLADVAARFAAVEPDEVESEIAEGMRRLIDFLGFDRSTLLEYSPQAGRLVAVCSVAVPGVDPFRVGPLEPRLCWYEQRLLSDQIVAFANLPDDLPPEAQAERELCLRTGVRSNLMVPLKGPGDARYGLTLAAFRGTRSWPEALTARLTLAGDVFVLALQRAQSERGLRAALAEVSALKERLESENVYLREAARPRVSADALVSHAAGFRAALEAMRQVARTNSTVLLLGETGTGKELMAEAIHALSARARGPMIKVNCAALPATLIEAELFGREKGAFTGALTRQAGRFELADRGTILLDEIGDLPLELQPKLLRVLQQGELERVGGVKTIRVDVRLIAATNRDLRAAARDGKFREDLYYRLSVFPVELPPLRERVADIPMLVWQFVREFSDAMGKPVAHVPDETMAALRDYAWPGNIRELRNVIERAMILARDGTLRVTLPRTEERLPAPAADSLAGAERRHVEQMLAQCGWRIRGDSGAAARLGMKPTTLESRMRRLGITRPR